MRLIRKIGAVILLGGLLLTVFREYVLIIIVIWLLLKTIRFIADIFWWGKDNGKW